MSETVNWITPSVGDVVLLAKGFENYGQLTGPHYGLVVGRFKVNANQTKFLMIAPGSSKKTDAVFDSDNHLLVNGGNVVGRDTVFFFQHSALTIYPFPSHSFLKSNAVQPQSDQVSSVKGVLHNASNLIGNIRAFHSGDMMNLYRKVFNKFNIDSRALAQLANNKPVQFLL